MIPCEFKGGGGKGGGGKGRGKGSGGNWPSTTGNLSGGGRGNGPADGKYIATLWRDAVALLAMSRQSQIPEPPRMPGRTLRRWPDERLTRGQSTASWKA
jgi:hypothetical protein